MAEQKRQGVLEWLGLRRPTAIVRTDPLVEQRTQLWPPITQAIDPKTLSRQVWDEQSALSIPGLGRALQLYQLVGIMPLDCYAGVRPLRRPTMLDQPDPDEPGSSWFIQQHITDWLLSGNACHLITSRDATGWPSTVKWFPAHQWNITQGTLGEDRQYWLAGRRVDRDNVVHVKRGADPYAPSRGIGVVEQHLRTLDRAGLEEESERQNLREGGVPSVAVIIPQKQLNQTDVDDAGEIWDEMFAGPGRRPAFLPNGTQVIPLGWSASDSQMIEARQMSLVDIANLTGLDGYWLGAPASSHTYRTPGPLYLNLLRTTLERPIVQLEQAWSQAWLPRGRTVRFDRRVLTRDDLASNIIAMGAARTSSLYTYEEARIYLDMDPEVPEPKSAVPAAPSVLPAPDQTDPNEPDDQGDEQEEAA